ncbi:MAG: threonine--tRNA ligase [Holosporaceae bacterium]
MVSVAAQDILTGKVLAEKAGLRDAVAVSLVSDEEGKAQEARLCDLSKEWPPQLAPRLKLIRRDDPKALSLLRHDAAHVMAEAVKELFSDVQVTIGPATQDGFYYDFYRKEPFKEDDLPRIEEKMHQIVARNEPFVREEWSRDKAIAYFKEQGEVFKVELIEALPEGEVISIYRQGAFLDLCRGPHLPSTGLIGSGFKLLRLAGAYWRGDAKNPMLQRIYGTAFPTEKALKVYLKNLEEAKKRDHRRLGTDLDLFHFQDIAQGSVFWHPKGWTIYTQLQTYIRNRLQQEDYQEVNTPQLLNRTLWEKSGHWDKFRENMITCALPEGHEQKEPLALKPMNCPGHVEIFKKGLKSYKDLPLRMAEFGSCCRFEPSGALLGLMRVRAFTQDDAHIFCTPSMIESETKAFCALLKSVYKDFGFEDVTVLFSDRPEKRAGSDRVWDEAENALLQGAKAAGLAHKLNPGEGAFYGPKLEFVLKDTLGRSWQCGTLQVDMVLPGRLGARYIGSDGAKHTPVMLHRAILGSFERFIGILIEHYAGNFPLWLAPCQVAVLPITNDLDDYAQQVLQTFKQKGLRAQIDTRPLKIHAKIREWSLQKTPYLAVVGAREAENQQVALRCFGKKDTNEVVLLKEAAEKLATLSKMPHC